MAFSQQDLDNFNNAVVEKPTKDLADSLNAATFGNPDQYAQDRQISKDTGVPTDLVQYDREELKRKGSFTDMDWQNFNNASPKTMKWLEDTPEGVRISYDDIETLRHIERVAERPWYGFDKRTFDGLGDSMMIGLGKVYDQTMLAYLSDVDETGLPVELYAQMEASGLLTSRRVERADRIKMHIESLRTAENEIRRLTPPGLTVGEEGARGGIQMIADMAPGMLISLVSRGALNPTLAMLTAKTGLDSYGSARIEGMNHADALTYGGIDALLEFATERIPTKALERILGKVGKGEGSIKRKLKEWFYAEAGGEQIATLTQSLNAYLHELDEEMTDAVGRGDMEEILAIQGRRQAVTFISTLAGGGSMSATIGAVDWLATADKRAQAAAINKAYTRLGSERTQEQLDGLFFLSQQAKLNERDAGLYQDFMEKIAPGQKLYISMDALAELTEIPEALASQVDGSGADVSISLAEFINLFGKNPEAMKVLRPHIKTNPQLMTQNEMELDTDSAYIKDLLQRAEQSKATKDTADAIFNQIVAELKATGMQSELTSRQSAELYPAMVTTQYEDLKARGVKNKDGSEITVQQLFEDMGFRIAKPDEKVGQEGAEFLEQSEQALFHVTFTKNLERIAEKGLMLFEPSLWVNPSGDRMGDAQVYGFESAEAALRWSQKQGFDFNESVSIIKLIRDELWEEDPSDYMSNLARPGRSMRRMGPVAASEILGSINLDDFGYPVPRDMTPEAWAAEVVSAIEGIAENLSQSSRVLKQQNFGNISVTETVVDEAGNVHDITQSAQVLWDDQQTRMETLQDLRECMSA